MERFLPVFFAITAAGMLFSALYALWQSFRVLLGAASADSQRSSTGMDDRRASLSDEKHALLRTLKDLDFERAVGKVSEEDFVRLNAQYRERAKELMRELDADIAPQRVEARRLIERATKDMKSGSSDIHVSSTTGDAVAASNPSLALNQATSKTCGHCSAMNDEDAEFCKKCGKPLQKAGTP